MGPLGRGSATSAAAGTEIALVPAVSDREIAQMAAFGVRSCANRILQLARKAGASPLGDALADIAADLLQQEAQLRTAGVRLADREPD